MSSAAAVPGGDDAAALFADPDRTARARIRDAALARFAADGMAATSVKSIAADAGVSAPLVIHHFGSKEGLAAACDEYVAAQIRERKHEAMSAGPGYDPFQAIRDAQTGPPLLSYLAGRLADPSPQVAALIDEMVDDAVGYMAAGVESGLLKATDHPRERAVVLVVWSLGALVLHEHVERLLGVDLLRQPDDPAHWAPWLLAAGEVLAKGIMDEGYYEMWSDAVQRVGDEAEPTKGPQTRTDET